MGSHDDDFDMMDDDIDWSTIELPSERPRSFNAGTGASRAITTTTTTTTGTSIDINAAFGIGDGAIGNGDGGNLNHQTQNQMRNPVIDLTQDERNSTATGTGRNNPHPFQNHMNSTTNPYHHNGISHTNTSMRDHGINSDHNNANNNLQENQNLKEQIQKLQDLLAQKDEQLFNLESSIATVEAETAYMLKKNQQKQEEQMKAKDDEVRLLEKEIGMKNVTIVRLKKNMDLNGGGGVTAANGGATTSPMINTSAASGAHHMGTNDAADLNAYHVNGVDNTRSAAMDVDGNDDGDPSRILQSSRHNPHPQRISPPVHGHLSGSKSHAVAAVSRTSTSGVERTTMRHQTPPLDKDSHESISFHSTAPQDSINHNKAEDPMDVSNPAGNLQMQVQSQSQWDRVEASLVSKRREEMVDVLSHLLRCCEQSSMLHGPWASESNSTSPDLTISRKSTSVEKAGQSSSSGKKRQRALMGDQDDSRRLGLRYSPKGYEVHDFSMAKQYNVIRDLLLHLNQKTAIVTDLHYNSLGAKRTRSSSKQAEEPADTLSRFSDLPGVGYIAKELVSMIGCRGRNAAGSQQEDNRPCDLVTMSILVELSSMNIKARGYIRAWLSSSSCSSVKDKEGRQGGSRKLYSSLSHIRGLPEKYQQRIRDVEKVDQALGSSLRNEKSKVERRLWDNIDQVVMMQSFRDSIVTWVIGISSSNFEDSHATYLQRTSLKLLHMLLHDSPSQELLGIFKSIVQSRNNSGSNNHQGRGQDDIISILEKTSVYGLNNIGRRHYLLRENDETNVFGVIEFKFPPSTLVEVKTSIVQLLHQFAESADVKRFIFDPDTMTMPLYRSNVCYGRRIIAALLDDLQCCILPFLFAEDYSIKDSSQDILQYGTAICCLLASLSNSDSGFLLMRTEMKVGGERSSGTENEEYEFAASCIGLISDYLVNSTSLLIFLSNRHCIGGLRYHRNQLYPIQETVESAVFFLYNIHRWSTRDAARNVPSFYAMLSDAERIEQMHSTLKTLLHLEKVNKLTQCQVRSMLQSMMIQ